MNEWVGFQVFVGQGCGCCLVLLFNTIIMHIAMLVLKKRKKTPPWPVWLSWLEHHSVHNPKGHRFNSQSGHTPGWKFQVRACARGNRSMFLSLPSPFSKINQHVLKEGFKRKRRLYHAPDVITCPTCRTNAVCHALFLKFLQRTKSF